jgi:hypothetical protein
MRFKKIRQTGIFLIWVSVAAFSQENKEPAAKPAAADVKTNPAAVNQSQQPMPAQVVDDNAVKVFLDKIEIEGRLEKPQAVFIIPGSNPEIDDINIERAFFNEIFRPVEKKGRVLARPTQPGQERKDVIPW